MTYNAARRRDVREAEKLAKLTEQQRREIIKTIMDFAPGRKWVYDLLEFCSCFQTTFHSNPLAMGFNEGKRTVGLRLLSDINEACPDLYIQMVRERNQQDAARSNASDARDNADDDAPEQPGGPDPDGGTEGRPVGSKDPGDDWIDSVYGPHEANASKQGSTGRKE